MKLLIDTNWAPFIADLPTEKQLEFFWAVFDYGNRECSLKCWDMIQPILEKGKIGYYNKLRTLKHVSDKIIDTTTDTIIDTSVDTTTDTIIVSESVSVNNSKHSRNNSTQLHTTRVKQDLDYPTEYQDIKNYLASQISQKLGRTVPTRGWLDDIRKLCEIDHADPKRVLDALRWHFDNYDREYRLEIQSAKTLREKFTRLDMAYQAASKQDAEPFYL